MIKVLVADDQALVRGGLVAMLNLEPDLTVVAEVSTGDEVLPAAARAQPDVALLDVQMPGTDGLTAAAELRRVRPSCKVIICTTFGRPGYFARAMAAGATGFVLKDAPPEHLVEAIRRVHAGLRVVDPDLAAESLATGVNPLTDRERDVLRTARQGRTATEIAKVLHLSNGTVRNHLSSAIGKTNAASGADAARIADNNGWL
ncbi:MAG TPA: response regulator transcription factor [Pseudonocardia sp.]|uniref:response regulator transcription factor n=1 Tax=Pseudonocardia sp. TaxID=60912 RepID=UPI002C687CB3|nr:response regulator transcription factor [Pseudonocardia sp.]HTF47399.1 response regulator transcription factor [Pseudonocardia sp.]